MTPAELLQQKMGLMRQKNDHYFKKHHPTIYNVIKDKNLTESEISIVPSANENELEIDVIEKGQGRYFGKGIEYSQKETEKFLTQNKRGSTITSMAPPVADSFIFDRVASNHFKQLANDLSANINYGNKYPRDNFIPLLVITGIGLGFHIEKLLEDKQVGCLIIFEHKLDRFLTSLYTVDWEDIHSKFGGENNGSIQLVLSYGKNANNHKASLWNELVSYCPHFPFNTVFYNHLTDNTCTNIIKNIQSDVPTYTNQWGHFDDELNQYNNARHNLLSKAKAFTPSNFNINPHIPVVIVGGGPSLDSRIEILKKHRDKILIISCGTSIGSLFAYGLKPHIHVELESDLITYEALKKSTDEEFREDILLIGAAQLNPLALNLFKKRCIFFKDSSALSKLYLENDKDVVSSATPTCTNAGVALATKLGFNNIFLTGLDFGFIDKNKHHADGSIYFSDDVSKPIQDSNDFSQNSIIPETSVHGQPMWTKPMYFTAKRRIEETIKYYHVKRKKIYNSSDGAVIKNAPWTSPERFDKLLMELTHSVNPNDLTSGIHEHCKVIETDIINIKSNSTIKLVDDMFNILLKSKPNKESTLFEVSNYIFNCNNSIVRTLRKKEGALIFFLRGHIWIFLMFFFTYIQLAKSKEDREQIINYMNNWIIKNRELILKEMNERMFSNTPMKEDAWVTEPFDRH